MTESNLDAPKAPDNQYQATPQAESMQKPYEPPPEVKPIPSQEEIKAADDKKDEAPKTDHFAEIAELVSGLENTTPSGANTIGAKIMFHVGALRDPEAFEKAEAEKREAEKKAAEEAAKQTKAAKEGEKAKVEKAA